MNYHILALVKAIIGIITLVLILFFVNPYQDYILGIVGLLIGFMLFMRAIGYSLAWSGYKLRWPGNQTFDLKAYGFGFLFACICLLCLCVMLMYRHYSITIASIATSLFILGGLYRWSFPAEHTESEDIY